MSATAEKSRRKMRPSPSQTAPIKRGFLGKCHDHCSKIAAISLASHHNRRRYAHSPTSRHFAIHAAPACDTPLSLSPNFLARCVKYLLGVAIFFLTTTAVSALISELAELIPGSSFLTSAPVWFSLVGFLAWHILWFGNIWRKPLIYLYVVGHELAHAVAIWASFGKVHEIRVSASGGFVTSNKDNLFIALAPYLVPFWSLCWMLLYGLTAWVFPDVRDPALFYIVLGAFWGFHITLTFWTIKADQPDLRDKGTFFSLSVVYLGNVATFVLGFSCMPNFHFTNFISSWAGAITGFFSAFIRLLP